MDLWIRSQDREDLIEVDNLGLAYLEKYNFVDKIGDIHRNEYHICQFEENCHTTLGHYKTKERALEVLDEIQKFIEEFQSVTAELNEYGEVTNVEHHKKVYEMPKE